uniref:Replication factor C C-terminal domain-containing protein n=1 Tax=viral metagenome TaxID=1070528 RepID=A0A6C0L0D2_9ZZZZ|tara:strand:- start:12177 stop:12929 length:753 start_codon:yes stop_codon:yes gene_type:complete
MEKVKTKLNNFVKKDSIPNILFYGPYMCGKEEIFETFIKNIYKTSEKRNKYVMTINCLSTNGIKIIKEHIKLFSMQIFNKAQDVNFKTIVLQHADNLTYDSQYSLRRTIEQYSKTTRFIFICENKYRLLNPLSSRFAHIYINENPNKNLYNNICKFNYGKYNSLMDRYELLIKTKEENQLLEIYKISVEFHNHNFYCFEIFQKLRHNPNYQNFSLVLGKINRNLCNDLFSIFYLLVVFRNNIEIEIYDYY